MPPPEFNQGDISSQYRSEQIRTTFYNNGIFLAADVREQSDMMLQICADSDARSKAHEKACFEKIHGKVWAVGEEMRIQQLYSMMLRDVDLEKV
jgi:hypothetical protein